MSAHAQKTTPKPPANRRFESETMATGLPSPPPGCANASGLKRNASAPRWHETSRTRIVGCAAGSAAAIVSSPLAKAGPLWTAAAACTVQIRKRNEASNRKPDPTLSRTPDLAGSCPRLPCFISPDTALLCTENPGAVLAYLSFAQIAAHSPLAEVTALAAQIEAHLWHSRVVSHTGSLGVSESFWAPRLRTLWGTFSCSSSGRRTIRRLGGRPRTVRFRASRIE